jgi:putative ABC transport system permease protein
MNALGQDLAFELRSLRSARGFTLIVILTLALGIGANAAIFSAVDAALLRPLPLPAANRVVNLAWHGDGHLQALSALKFQYWHEHARSFEAMATWRPELARIEVGGEVSSIRMLSVSRGFLQTLGYAPSIGRDFTAAEHTTGSATVALVSQPVWRTRFGGESSVVGRTIRVNGETVTLAGVLPESFVFPYEDAPVDVVVPFQPKVDPGDIAEDWPAIARLRDGVTRAQAQAEVTSLNQSFRATYPNQADPRDRGMTVATFAEIYVADGIRRALWILMGAVTLVLLIACANVGNLFLARGLRRRGEIALRAALGASRIRIIRLILAESVFVALAAGAIGLMLGKWIAGALIALTPVGLPQTATIDLDWRVTVFTFALALLTSVLFGGAAAWPVVRACQTDGLNENARGSSGSGRGRQAFLVAQSALSMVLLVGAGLLLATLLSLMHVDPGFEPHGRLGVRIPSKPSGYETSSDLWRFEQRVLERLAGSPVIESIAGASSLPLERGINTPITIAGRPDLTGTVEWRAVTSEYFRTLAIRSRTGRTFRITDTAGSPAVAVVNEAFARRYFANQNPIGQRIEVGRFRGQLIDASLARAAFEVVGVVADIRDVSLRTEPRRTIYVSQAQAPTRLSRAGRGMPVFIAESRLPLVDVERALTEAIRAVDPALPKPELFPLDDIVVRSLARERFGAALLSVLAALALGLTVFGIYSVLAYTVQQRRREIGIRMALGARQQQVMGLVMRQGILPVVGGVILGVLGSIALSKFIAGFLWGVTATDPTTIGMVAATLTAAAVAASWVPSREAARVDPVTSLKSD